MIDIKTAMEIGNYRVTGGARYCWKCFGPNAWYMDFDTNLHDTSYGFIYDTVTQVIYEVTVCDYNKNNCYRIIHPDYVDEYRYEAESKNCNPNQAFDDVEYSDIEDIDDFIAKATAINNGDEYDERVTIKFDVSDDVLLVLMKAAHEKDITFNQYLEEILQAAIDRTKAT